MSDPVTATPIQAHVGQRVITQAGHEGVISKLGPRHVHVLVSIAGVGYTIRALPRNLEPRD